MRKRSVTPPASIEERILTTAELVERVPLRRETIWRMVREGRFVKPIRLTRSRIGWRWSAVLAWLAERENAPLDRREYFGDHNKRKKSA